MNDRMRPRAALVTVTVLVAVSVLASGCTSSSSPAPPVSLPVPKTGEVTFYLSLPASTARLSQAAAKVAEPGSSDYRHFSSLATAASQFGATDAQIRTIAASVQSLGLQFAADPTRLFGRVSGSAKQWQAALRTPLTQQAATASNPFITYDLPSHTPAALQPSGTGLLLRETEVYDPAAEGRKPPGGNGPAGDAGTTAPANPAKAAEPWPTNTGTPATVGCSATALLLGEVYTAQQIQTAYGLSTMRAHASGTPVITILDLGGGWLPSDLKLAGQCFGYSPPHVDQTQGDGVVTAIANAGPETSLDLQTAAAVAPKAQFRLVQTNPAGGGILDAFSRALGGPNGLPDVISLSYGGCAIQENTATPVYQALLDAGSHLPASVQPGILIDEQYGTSIADLAARTGGAISLAMPVEASGEQWFHYAYDDWQAHAGFFAADYAKILIRDNPGLEPAQRAAQAERLAKVSDWAAASDRALIVELLVPASAADLAAVGGAVASYDVTLRPEHTVQVIGYLQDDGVTPALWEVEGLDRHDDAVAIAAVAKRGGRTADCIVLGRHASDDQLDHWLQVAAPVPGFTGFGIGRSIWWDPLHAHLHHRITAGATRRKIARAYLYFVRYFLDAREGTLPVQYEHETL